MQWSSFIIIIIFFLFTYLFIYFLQLGTQFSFFGADGIIANIICDIGALIPNGAEEKCPY